MAIQRNLNKTGLGGNYVMWWAWNTMVQAGAVVSASGSGTGGSYSDVGDVFDHNPGQNPFTYPAGVASLKLGSGFGAEPWRAAKSCWVMLDMPDGSQIIIQGEGWGGNWDGYWNIICAPNGDFILVGCGVDVCPSTTTSGKMANILGTPNGVGVLVSSDAAVPNLTHVAMENVPDADGCYPFIVTEVIAPNTLKFVFMIDTFTQRKSDLMASHARAYWVATGATGLSRSTLEAGAAGPKTYIDFGGGSEAWGNAIYVSLPQSGGYLYPGSAGAPAAGQPDHPITVGNITHGGMFGLSYWLQWQATVRLYPITDNTLVYWYLGDIALAIGDGLTAPTAMP